MLEIHNLRARSDIKLILVDLQSEVLLIEEVKGDLTRGGVLLSRGDDEVASRQV